MDKLSMCRICLVEDVKMYFLINANLQVLYERLTDMPFMTEDKKPVQVCYLCRARLQNCHRLQATCLRSEEFFNNIMANSKIKQMESQGLNTLKTVHPLINISCVPSMRKETNDDKIDEYNDFKCDPLEITFDARVKEEFFEDNSFINGAVNVKVEATVEDEDIGTDDGDMSDTQLQHDIQLKPVKIALERIDLEQFKIGFSAAKNPKIDLLNGNTESSISVNPETEVTIAQNNKEKSYICNVCGKSFTLKTRLVTHIRIHTGERPYRCNECGKSYNHKGNLVKHTRIHTGERLCRCNVCGKSFNVKNYLAIHLRIHTGERPYTCNLCGKSFNRKGVLVRHIRTHTGERPHRCNICGKRFSLKSNLVTHLRIHTGERTYKVRGKSFIQKSSLVKHTRVQTGERSYRCDVCGKNFNHKCNLVTHIRIHTGERPYSCDVCGKSFNRRDNLVTHTTRIHTGKLLSRSNVCGKKNIQKSSLVTHARKHTGERPYACNVCGKSFTQKSSLARHIRILHTGEL